MNKGEKRRESFTISIRTLGGLGELKITRGGKTEYTGPIGVSKSEELFDQLYLNGLREIMISRGRLYYED